MGDTNYWEWPATGGVAETLQIASWESEWKIAGITVEAITDAARS